MANPAQPPAGGGIPDKEVRDSALQHGALRPRARRPRLGIPKLGCRAIQHPIRVDAADAVHWRLSDRCEMAIRLFPRQLSFRASRSFTAGILGQLPQRGDVVVFKHPSRPADLIKRVIGLPGDTVEFGAERSSSTDAHPARALADFRLPITLNALHAVGAQSESGGPPRRHPFASIRAYRETLPAAQLHRARPGRRPPADDSRPSVVPAGRLFLMGDNRDDSLDSRFPPRPAGASASCRAKT